MDNPRKFQILKLSLIAALLFITPLLSSSLRPTFLYFIINLLVITVGVEAGLLSFFSKLAEEKKPALIVQPKPEVASETSPDKEGPANTKSVTNASECTQKRQKVIQKSDSEKIAGGVKMQKVKKCAPMPSIFFIGGGGDQAEEVAAEDYDAEQEGEKEEEEVGGLTGQELFANAEAFIANFYKQLKMQREES